MLGAVAAVTVFLYWRPLSTYVETRAELRERQTEVAGLRAEKRRLESRLAFAATVESLRREARRIGYVRPGEQLFIVKGIERWKRAQHATD